MLVITTSATTDHDTNWLVEVACLCVLPLEHSVVEYSWNQQGLIMNFDIEKARMDTPGCLGVIHLHHSGSALMPKPVVDAMYDHLDQELLRGGYEAEEDAQEELDNTYNSIALLLNSKPSEIALSESATASWLSAFGGIAQTFRKGDRILTAYSEYVSNMIAYLQIAKRTGVEVDIIPDDKHGQLDVRALERMIDNRVKLVSVTHVPTHNGLVNPVNEIGEVVRSYGIPYLVDACQSVGQMPLDVEEIRCDALSATGRKFLRGPRGTGFLYVRESSLDKFPPAFLDLHSATMTSTEQFEIQPGARRYEMFESNIAGRIGLGVAVDYAMSWGLHEIYTRIRFLADRLRESLADIKGVTLRDKGKEKCGIVTFSMESVDPLKLQRKLRKKNIHIGVSNLSNAPRDMNNWGVESISRCPVHYYNTEEEIEYFVKQLSKLVAQ